jgi:hypothetical protein
MSIAWNAKAVSTALRPHALADEARGQARTPSTSFAAAIASGR